MVVLDTNHITVLGYATTASQALLQRLDDSTQEAVTTVITLEEQMRGWLAAIHKLKDVRHQIVVYDRLRIRTEFLAKWVLLPWDEDAANRFVQFREKGIRIATMDLKIACITLAHDATLLTRNTVDFQHVPGLRFANWLD